MIRKILVILFDDADPSMAHYGQVELVHVNDMTEEAMWKRLEVETMACLMKAYESSQGMNP